MYGMADFQPYNPEACSTCAAAVITLPGLKPKHATRRRHWDNLVKLTLKQEDCLSRPRFAPPLGLWPSSMGVTLVIAAVSTEGEQLIQTGILRFSSLDCGWHQRLSPLCHSVHSHSPVLLITILPLEEQEEI